MWRFQSFVDCSTKDDNRSEELLRGQNWSGFIGSAGHKWGFMLPLHYASQGLCWLQVKYDCSADAHTLGLLFLPLDSLHSFLKGWMSLILNKKKDGSLLFSNVRDNNQSQHFYILPLFCLFTSDLSLPFRSVFFTSSLSFFEALCPTKWNPNDFLNEFSQAESIFKRTRNKKYSSSLNLHIYTYSEPNTFTHFNNLGTRTSLQKKNTSSLLLLFNTTWQTFYA